MSPSIPRISQWFVWIFGAGSFNSQARIQPDYPKSTTVSAGVLGRNGTAATAKVWLSYLCALVDMRESLQLLSRNRPDAWFGLCETPAVAMRLRRGFLGPGLLL